jgi:hypothetical protein
MRKNSKKGILKNKKSADCPAYKIWIGWGKIG